MREKKRTSERKKRVGARMAREKAILKRQCIIENKYKLNRENQRPQNYQHTDSTDPPANRLAMTLP